MKLAFPVLLVLAAAFQTFAAEYKIQLSKPAKVGDGYHLSGTAIESSDTSVLQNGEPLNQQKVVVTWTLEADVTVEEISAKQQASRLRILISEFDVAVNDQKNSLMSPGTVVTATVKDDNTDFTVADAPVNQAAQKGLAHLTGVPSPTDPTEQQVFGTDNPQPVGGTWKMDAKNFAAAMNGPSMKIDPRAAVGRFNLAEVKEVDGKQVMRVEGEVKVSEVGVPVQENLKLSRSAMKINLSQLYPVDGSTGRLQETARMELKFVASGQPNDKAPIFTFDTTAVIQTETKYTYE